MEKNQKNFKLWEICKIEEASTLCYQCFSYFCDDCFKYVHDKGNNNKHEKEKIDYFVPIDIWCPKHEKNEMNLFCNNEKGNNLINNIILKDYRTLLFILFLWKSS